MYKILILIISFLSTSNSPQWEEKNYEAFFNEENLKGSFLLYDLKKDKYFVYDKKRCNTQFIPASTFKIINSLIGLETKVVKDEHHIFPWNGEKSRVEAWNQDHTLTSAFSASCVPCYQDLARKVGVEKMKKYTSLAGYGSMDIKSENIDRFWLEGDSKISQMEQIEFLVKLYQGELPFSNENIGKVKEIMLVEDHETHQIRAKTGLGIKNDEVIGWYVGYVTKADDVYFFALNFSADMENNGVYDARKGITTKIFKDLSIL